MKGFDFKNNVILEDRQMGYKFLINKNADHDFDLIYPREISVKHRVAQGWKKQIFIKGCWLAAMAVLAQRTQKDIQEELGWPNDAFYSISMKELPEFGEMIKCPVKAVNTDIDSLAAACVSSPVILGVPRHVVVLYAVSANKKFIWVWDPETEAISEKSWEEYGKFIDPAYYRA